MATTVLLVDGVGAGVKFQRERDVLTIVLRPSGTAFVKTNELRVGLEVYRLKGTIGPKQPRIRSVDRYRPPA